MFIILAFANYCRDFDLMVVLDEELRGQQSYNSPS